MTKEVDYKAEVKKKYRKAYCVKSKTKRSSGYKVCSGLGFRIAYGLTIGEAWEAAYRHIFQ